MYRDAQVVIKLRCPTCNEPLEVKGKLFDIARVRCPRCGTIVIAKINVTLTSERITENDLEEFKKWLVKEKGLMKDTAERYAKDVEKWIKEGKWPRTIAPIEYWRMWKEKRH